MKIRFSAALIALKNFFCPSVSAEERALNAYLAKSQSLPELAELEERMRAWERSRRSNASFSLHCQR
jgi:hypothetical protein